MSASICGDLRSHGVGVKQLLVLGTELRSSVRAVHALNHGATASALILFLSICMCV